ncbi:AraC family transcriptional regulator ligand-binding domain-containing protein [Pseudomonas sp.]|uniref:AraC family transcriptional regulator ligand-binding domain-containing protein n=1 Tax=Pseudomonas sp. TaxID=306 RepID=UPI003564EF9F
MGLVQRGTGLSFNQLRDPNVQVSASAELRVISNLCQSSLLPETLGFQAGLRYSFSTYGLWGLGLISSATLGDAMTLALRFFTTDLCLHVDLLSPRWRARCTEFRRARIEG